MLWGGPIRRTGGTLDDDSRGPCPLAHPPASRWWRRSTQPRPISEGFTPFVVGGIVKAVIAGIALPGAWWLVNRGDRLG
jgi:hypothetical protein